MSELHGFLLMVLLLAIACRCDAGREGRPVHPLKTIKTNAGDIFDCVDIYKQPAFDHPLLKDHVIQMKPNIQFDSPVGTKKGNDILNLELEDGGCPQGTVPIHRLPSANNSMAPSTLVDFADSSHTQGQNNLVKMSAIRSGIPKNYFGASSKINVYAVISIRPGQESSGFIKVGNSEFAGHEEAVAAGWTVSSDIYHDYQTRFTARWTADLPSKGYCINTQCSGFVQVNPKIPLGAIIQQVSEFGGTQYYIYLHIYRDFGSNWVLAYGDVNNTVGYWPAELFKYMDRGNNVDFGGHVSCHWGDVCPPMRNGHGPSEGGCTMEEVQVIEPDHDWEGLGKSKSQTIETESRCYWAGLYKPDVHGYKFRFGGPPCNTAGL